MRVSKPVRNILIYVSIAAVLLTAGLFVYSDKWAAQNPDFTSLSTGPRGVRALYLLAEQMGFQVEQYGHSAGSLPEDAVLVAFKPDLGALNDKQERKHLREWLRKGNVFIIIDDPSNADAYRIPELTGKYTSGPDGKGADGFFYTVGDGELVYLNGYEAYTNEGLKELEPGVKFIRILEDSEKKRVLFDEYYHGLQDDALTPWNLLGQTGELVFIQLLLGLLVWMLIKARRFGKPVTVFEIVKRRENENLFALSNIYIKAKANAMVLQMYLAHFKKGLSKYLGFSTLPGDEEILAAASGNRFLSGRDLKGLFFACDYYISTRAKDSRQLLHLIGRLEEIRKGIK